MKKAVRFEALGLDIPLGMFQRFTDHGFVEDPRDYVKCGGEPADGIAWGWLFGGLFGHVNICYADANPFECGEYTDMRNLHVRAHEETHALHGLNKLNFLERALAKEGVNIDLRSIKSREVLADICAIYALCQKYGGTEEHESLLNYFCAVSTQQEDEFKKAMSIFLDRCGSVIPKSKRNGLQSVAA